MALLALMPVLLALALTVPLLERWWKPRVCRKHGHRWDREAGSVIWRCRRCGKDFDL